MAQLFHPQQEPQRLAVPADARPKDVPLPKTSAGLGAAARPLKTRVICDFGPWEELEQLSSSGVLAWRDEKSVVAEAPGLLTQADVEVTFG